ncbi:GNAT family N-acetyltransferase [Streptomyces malaysiense]|uniref:GNAT family N-acetyltransferase n=1 Tax=Streptomyces malaysiense TaxID=1428626 RepID=A0A1J4Q514_9ACTN|nr:GNAT family N-acetyltransferase [Streptomyces malaysiense]OIK28283.1 GNAT family N-acetyltransferase [Streptomyces malaysiense]
MADPSAGTWPAGYRVRPATTTDTDAVHRLVGAGECALHGRVTTGADRIAADLGGAQGEPACDTVLVTDRAGDPAAWGWVRGRRATVHVHPGHRGRGLGAALLAWTEARARELGGDRLAQTISDSDLAATALLRSGGYVRMVTEWLLEMPMPHEPVVPEPPSGITVRAFRAGDEEAAYRLTEDAFDEWQQRRKPYAEWARHTVGRATFAPAASPLAFVDGRLVGAVLALDPGTDGEVDAGVAAAPAPGAPDGGEGYVERVAVRRDQRNRGIARLLLQEAFRAFYRQGKRSCVLWTHSDTGALPLYERIGMTVRRSSTVYGKALVAR